MQTVFSTRSHSRYGKNGTIIALLNTRKYAGASNYDYTTPGTTLTPTMQAPLNSQYTEEMGSAGVADGTMSWLHGLPMHKVERVGSTTQSHTNRQIAPSKMEHIYR